MQQTAQWEMQRAMQAQWEVQSPMNWEGQPAVQWEELPSGKLEEEQSDEPEHDPLEQDPLEEQDLTQSEEHDTGKEQSPTTPKVSLDLLTSLSLPSTGSALHNFGKCRPCAWFWKSQGCLNGQACGHCHLCPEGELKVRKRVKETAMRIGALLPARRGLDSRSPRIVKIAPILGA